MEDCAVVGPATELNGMRGVGKTLANTPSPDGLGGVPSGGHAQMCFGLMTKRGCNVDLINEEDFSPNTVYGQQQNLTYMLLKGEWYIRNGVTARKIVAGSSLCSVPSKRRLTQANALEGQSVIGRAHASAALWRRTPDLVHAGVCAHQYRKRAPTKNANFLFSWTDL